jgi:hypothetical protein
MPSTAARVRANTRALEWAGEIEEDRGEMP